MKRTPDRTARARRSLLALACGGVLAAACGGDDSADREVPTANAPRSAEHVWFAPPALESVPDVAAAPLTPSERRGRELYNTQCWTCHGLYGHGDGPAARGYAAELPDLGSLASSESADRIAQRLAERNSKGLATAAGVAHTLPRPDLHAIISYLARLGPRDGRGNPSAGRLIYATYCVACHGARGDGDGPLAGSMRRPVPDLRSLGTEGQESRVYSSIRHGSPPDHEAFMPRWEEVFTRQQISDLVAYLAVLRRTR